MQEYVNVNVKTKFFCKGVSDGSLFMHWKSDYPDSRRFSYPALS